MIKNSLLALSCSLAVCAYSQAATLVSYYDFEETSGTSAFDSARGVNETVIGTPVWSTDVAAPGSTRSIELDGATERIESTYQGLSGNVSRSISAWIKTSATGGIVGWGDSETAGAKWHFRLNDAGGNGVVGALRTEIQGSYEIDGPDLTDGNWHHVVSVYDGGDFGTDGIVRHYVDGTEVINTGELGGAQLVNTQLTSDYSVEGFTPVIIGGRQQGATATNFNGLLDDVAIYSGALTAAEVSQLFNTGSLVPEPSTTGLLALGGLALILRRRR